MDVSAMVAKACPDSEIAEIVQRTGGQLSTVFEVRRAGDEPLIVNNADKLAGLVDGYGALPGDWQERVRLYRVYHSLELWDWFKSTGETTYLDSIAAELTELVGN